MFFVRKHVDSEKLCSFRKIMFFGDKTFLFTRNVIISGNIIFVRNSYKFLENSESTNSSYNLLDLLNQYCFLNIYLYSKKNIIPKCFYLLLRARVPYNNLCFMLDYEFTVYSLQFIVSLRNNTLLKLYTLKKNADHSTTKEKR